MFADCALREASRGRLLRALDVGAFLALSRAAGWDVVGADAAVRAQQ